MQKSDNNQVAKVNRRKVQASTTLSRKYTKRPAPSNNVMVKVNRSPKVKRFNDEQMVKADAATDMVEPVTIRVESAPVAQTRGMVTPQAENMVAAQMQESVSTTSMTTAPMQEEPVQAAIPHPMQTLANSRMQERASTTQDVQTPRVSARELKDQAIQKALASASRMDNGKEQMESKKLKSKKSDAGQLHFGFGRVMLALGCAAAAVFAIVYFVNLNMPDISLRVAAMQTGIDPTYPNYVPRDYSVSSITSEEGKITMEFSNATNGGSFVLVEEKSSWDTNALASNYVKEEYGENYSIVREQGLTIYVSGSDAAWVNGGIVYKIKTTSGSLTNKQIRSIATSL